MLHDRCMIGTLCCHHKTHKVGAADELAATPVCSLHYRFSVLNALVTNLQISKIDANTPVHVKYYLRCCLHCNHAVLADPDRSPSAQDASEEDKKQLRQRWNEEMGGGGVHK